MEKLDAGISEYLRNCIHSLLLPESPLPLNSLVTRYLARRPLSHPRKALPMLHEQIFAYQAPSFDSGPTCSELRINRYLIFRSPTIFPS